MSKSILTLFTLLFIFAVAVIATRQKRQLSPAVQLENELSPLIRLAGLHDGGYYKRSFDYKRHLSPSLNVEDQLGRLIALQSVGKRHSPAEQYGQQFELWRQLAEVGKKRAISPSADLLNQLSWSEFLDQAGR
uniref:Serine/threonine protein kinase n=1 Tax=Ascaris lumbricoides TaxID=6252 RepID=A0A0M3HZJ4_ASCLU